MAQQSKETLIKRYESCAETYKKKGDREYAYAKNGLVYHLFNIWTI